jgi:hypothetical protein
VALWFPACDWRLIVITLLSLARGAYVLTAHFGVTRCAREAILTRRPKDDRTTYPIATPLPSAHGSLLCQDAVGSGVLGLSVTGPGSEVPPGP